MQGKYGWIHIGAQKQIWSFDTKKPQQSPHKQCPINYGAKQQIIKPTDNIPPLNNKGIKRVRGIVGELLCVERAANNEILVVLSAIGS